MSTESTLPPEVEAAVKQSAERLAKTFLEAIGKKPTDTSANAEDEDANADDAAGNEGADNDEILLIATPLAEEFPLATAQNIGAMLAGAKSVVDDRVGALTYAFMRAFQDATENGNASVIYFDDPYHASCFHEPADVEPTRKALEEALFPLFAEHDKLLRLRTDTQHDIRTPYRGERYTFIATISAAGPTAPATEEDDDTDDEEADAGNGIRSVRIAGINVDGDAGKELHVTVEPGGHVVIEKID
jgi:hypothetical protein